MPDTYDAPQHPLRELSLKARDARVATYASVGSLCPSPTSRLSRAIRPTHPDGTPFLPPSASGKHFTLSDIHVETPPTHVMEGRRLHRLPKLPCVCYQHGTSLCVRWSQHLWKTGLADSTSFSDVAEDIGGRCVVAVGVRGTLVLPSRCVANTIITTNAGSLSLPPIAWYRNATPEERIHARSHVEASNARPRSQAHQHHIWPPQSSLAR